MTQPIQTFDVKGGPEAGRRALPLIRAELDRLGIDGFVIPHEDEYDNEYLPAANERLAFATGFTGSAGAALVLKDRAALFVDGRYTLQAPAQVDGDLFDFVSMPEPGVAGWIAEHAKSGSRIGFDPRLHTPDAVARLQTACAKAGAELVALPENPVDAAWSDRPQPPAAPVIVHPLEFAGEAHADKRRRVAESLRQTGADAAVITSPASIAWLFNIRGGDVACTPLPLGGALIRADASADLFMNPAKLGDDVRAHLGNEVTLHPETGFHPALRNLSGVKVLADPASASQAVFYALEAGGASVIRNADPVALPKACKNPVEVDGARQAHVRDGAALAKFLHWLDTAAQDGSVDEIRAAVTLEGFRRESDQFRDLSFETISGAGPNGAVVHYRVNTATVRTLEPGSLYLVDSGAQYPDGTTDVTRTVPIGAPSDEMRRAFTLVLKGHIALSMVKFPRGITGAQLDALARAPLWAAGLDYDHGTGHGVGSYLGVHEGPQRIAKGPSPVALETGMIVSNEPGYYKTGAFGIRIENLQVVTPPQAVPGGEREMLGFETLTQAPIHRGLIETALLTADERSWLNAYHAGVLAKVGPRVEGEVRAWLEAACAPV